MGSLNRKTFVISANTYYAEANFMATDYWLNKLMFDLQGPDGKSRWAPENREATMADYPVSPEIRQALLDDDYAYLYPVTNPYLMRFFLLICGHDDDKSIEILSSIDVSEETAHG